MMTSKITGPTIAIFDVCDTLYDANTTFGFLEHYGRMTNNGALLKKLRRWTSRRSPCFYVGAAAHRILGRDVPRERLIAALAGEGRERLDDIARDYAVNILPTCANKVLHDRLVSHRVAGDRVILMSSSLDLVIAPIATALGVEYRASKLGFQGDRCTGRIECDLTGRKTQAYRNLSTSARSRLHVYTDNHSDKDILALADHATIVLAGGRNEQRWGGPSCDYIKL